MYSLIKSLNRYHKATKYQINVCKQSIEDGGEIVTNTRNERLQKRPKDREDSKTQWHVHERVENDRVIKAKTNKN